MQYGLAFNYVLNRTGGTANLLLVTVCNFIPVVGPIVTLGYRAEVSQALLNDEERRRHPKFKFDYFVDYLTRGLWPFVTGLIAAFIGMGFIVITFLLALLATLAAPEAGIVVGIAGYAVSVVAIIMLSAPMQFQAQLSGKLDVGASFRFAKSFWLTVGGQAILSWLIFIPLAVLVMIAGLLVCFVGIYPASALIQMAGQHLMVQLYDEYLDAGGEPIPLWQPPEEEYDDDDDDERRSRRRRP